MNIMEVIDRAFFQGYSTAQIGIKEVIICILCTALLSMYIYLVYKQVHKNSFYNRNFNISLIAMAIITSAIILTIQSNIVVSLGMVGALSIVRFRSAIKDPLDLIFLFWVISVGIICGAGFAFISVVASMVITIIILFITMQAHRKEILVLVVNADSYLMEKDILECLEKTCKYYHVRARNITKTSLNIAIEVSTDNRAKIIDILMNMRSIHNVSLVDCEGDVTV